MRPSMTFEGGEELARNLNALSARLSRKLLVEALIEAGEPMRAVAAQHARRAPGPPDLADNINIAPIRRRQKDDPKDVSVGIGAAKGFFYDFFLEMGTVHNRAFPFYRPAFDGERERALGIVGAALWRELAARGVSRSVSAPTTVDHEGPLL